MPSSRDLFNPGIEPMSHVSCIGRQVLYHSHVWVSLVQLLSHVWLCDPVDCSIPGFPVHHQLLELSQTHVHQVRDAVQLSHPLSSPLPSAFNLFQLQGLLQWVGWNVWINIPTNIAIEPVESRLYTVLLYSVLSIFMMFANWHITAFFLYVFKFKKWLKF